LKRVTFGGKKALTQV